MSDKIACLKHRYSGLAYDSNQPIAGTFDLAVAARGAVAALTQNCTHPADINAAVSFLLDGLARHDGMLPKAGA